jgi:hypothetical protein
MGLEIGTGGMRRIGMEGVPIACLCLVSILRKREWAHEALVMCPALF